MMRAITYGAAFVLAIGALGCGSGGQGELSGEVTFDGAPLEQGAILLTPLDTSKGAATGGEITNGRYALTGKQAPLAGAYKVEIRANKKSGRKVQKALGKPGELDDELIEAVAPRFNTNTELTVEVKSGAVANFAVASK
jgi:hypothetical protein